MNPNYLREHDFEAGRDGVVFASSDSHPLTRPIGQLPQPPDVLPACAANERDDDPEPSIDMSIKHRRLIVTLIALAAVPLAILFWYGVYSLARLLYDLAVKYFS